MNPKQLELTFWGVRGSIPTPFPENLGFGGNTACVAVRFGDQPQLIFDGGSGIRPLGNTLMDGLKTQETDFHLFLTHFHWDHIQGIPFFSPMYHPNSRTTIYSHEDPRHLHHILARQMEPPYYPVPMPSTEPKVAYRRIDSEGKHVGDVFIRPFPLHHPNGAFGYRIEAPGACIVYASDHEHGNGDTDSHLRQWAEGADLLIYDAQYTPDEYESHRGWGHSTWRKGVDLAKEARVGQLVLFHHDPLRSDKKLNEIVHLAQAEFKHTMAAKEGWSARFGAK